MSSYDEIKGMLNVIRKYNKTTNKKGIYEQVENSQKDFIVVNDVEIVLDSSDPMDHELDDENKNKISQLIDEFRDEVSELTEFNKLHLYSNSAKLEGKIPEHNINFILSAGDDSGLFLTNTSLMKINDETTDLIEKLKQYIPKYISTMEEIILYRKNN